MAKESSGTPLPRRVPGAADSPRPPARIKPPPLPESLIERLRAAAELAKEEEAAHAEEEEAAHAEEEAAHAEEEAAHPEGEPATPPAAGAAVAIPLPRRPSGGGDEPGPTQDKGSAWQSVFGSVEQSASLSAEQSASGSAEQSVFGPAEESASAPGPSAFAPRQIFPGALTQPIPAIFEPRHRDPADAGAAGTAGPQDAPAPRDGTAPPKDLPKREAPEQDGTAPPKGPPQREAPEQDGTAPPKGPPQREPPGQDGAAAPKGIPWWGPLAQDAPAPPNGIPRREASALQNGTAPPTGIPRREAPRPQDGTAPEDARALGNRASPQNGAPPSNRPAQLGPPARQWADPGTREGAGRRVSAAGPAREVWPPDQRTTRRPLVGRRLQITGVVLAVLTLTAAGALTMALSGHTAKPPVPTGRRTSAGKAEEVTRDLAAVWVAQQVSRTAVVSCDPVMCGALESHGVPASDLNWIEPNTTSPLASAVIVATAAVRAQFGNLLSSVYAPGVIARFGSGQLQIDIREVAPHGATAYRAAVHADLIDRKTSGAGLLGSGRIVASATARRQLITGQVDSRLIIMMAGLAAVHPIDIVAFGNVAPGGDLTMPLRFAEVTQAGRGHPAVSRSASPAFVRSIVAFVHGQPAGLGVAQTQTVRLPGGLTVLRIQFGAPTPLGLLGPH